LEDPGGIEPLAHGLKARCPTVSGLNAPGPRSWRCGGKPLRFFDGHGGSPVSDAGSPARYRTAVFRLSAGRSAFELREMEDGARSRTRTWECRCVRPMPWPLGEASAARRDGVAATRKQKWCTREDLNLHAVEAAASEAAASAVAPRVHCQSRIDGAATADRTPVSALPKRCPATGRLRHGAGWRTRTSRLSLTRRVLCPMS
jgi:hypothetical protein